MFGSAPDSRSSLATASLPFLAAKWSGVLPYYGCVGVCMSVSVCVCGCGCGVGVGVGVGMGVGVGVV